MNPRAAKLFSDLVQNLRGWDYRPALRELEKLQWAPEEQMRERSLTRLRSLLAYARENVPFYRQQFAQLDMNPEDIRDESDLRALPIVTKEMLRRDYSRFFARGPGPGYDEWASSGSTGEPFRFRLDKASIAANTFAALARGRKWWDVDFGVREGMIWSGVRDLTGTRSGKLRALRRRLSWGLKNIRLVDIYDLGPEAVSRGYEFFRNFQPLLIRAISSGLYRFCVGLEEQGLDGTRLGVRCAIFTGESFPAAQRALVERVLGCKTVCEYGSTETGIIAFECPAGGLHVAHDNLFVEYLRDGEPGRPGEDAELVVTNLNERAAPLVRYAVGDVVVPSDKSCTCGRTLPLISRISGRTHDKILTPHGTAVNGLFFAHLFDGLPNVHQFRVVQETLHSIRLELRSTGSVAQSDRLFLRRAVETVMGGGVAVEVTQVAEIPVSQRSGKVQWIVSMVQEAGEPRPRCTDSDSPQLLGSS